jgi:hypothetical protein
MYLARTIMTIRPHPAEFLYAEQVADLPARYEEILEAFLTSRGKPSLDVDQALAEDPESVFGHCLRAAIIVRGDDASARPKLIESVIAIETICEDHADHAPRHASAARAWLDGDYALAVECVSAWGPDHHRRWGRMGAT